jgi:SAM-dependent methyltransferase
VSFFNRTKLSDFERLVEECSEYIKIDKDLAICTVKNSLDVIKGNGKPEDSNQIIRLEKQWYSSLDGKPDYSVYSDPYYICDIWVCWVLYSHKALKAIANKKSLINQSVVDYLGEVKTVLDLGCGFGFTTSCLSEMFSNANVYGTNLLDTFQYKICEKISKKAKFEVVENSDGIRNADIVFASEYFEHIEESLEHLYEIIKKNAPRILVVANGYNGYAIGHFNEYLYQGRYFSAKKTSLNFGKMMRFMKYQKLKTKIWNSRPSIWVRI